MENQKDLGTPVAIVISGALIALSIYMTGGIKVISGPTAGIDANLQEAPREIVIRPVDKSDHIVGSINADVVVVSFTDLECPFCKRFHETMVRIMDEYRDGGRVSWVYRHMPLDMLHVNARKEAEATECASIVGGNIKFWEYTNKILAYTKSNDGLDLRLLPQIASEVGLDVGAFNDCLSGDKAKKAVAEDEIDAVSAGAQGTPYSVIITKDGKKIPIDGAMPFETVKAMIDSVLK
jgi:protein-disulfide isomerase